VNGEKSVLSDSFITFYPLNYFKCNALFVYYGYNFHQPFAWENDSERCTPRGDHFWKTALRVYSKGGPLHWKKKALRGIFLGETISQKENSTKSVSVGGYFTEGKQHWECTCRGRPLLENDSESASVGGDHFTEGKSL